MDTGTTKLLVVVILVGIVVAILAVAARRRRNAEARPAAAEGDPWAVGGQGAAGDGVGQGSGARAGRQGGAERLGPREPAKAARASGVSVGGAWGWPAR